MKTYLNLPRNWTLRWQWFRETKHRQPADKITSTLFLQTLPRGDEYVLKRRATTSISSLQPTASLKGKTFRIAILSLNYDIHWNPVRIIQRFGRIDRIGSRNTEIKMINYWPTEDMDVYLRLRNRVESRMALADATASGDDDPLNEYHLSNTHRWNSISVISSWNSSVKTYLI